MLQYLIILLDKSSTSYCHYAVKSTSESNVGSSLIPLNTLQDGIRFAMKENLNIQFVYPSFELPEDWKREIETIDHSKIKPIGQAFERNESDELGLDKADVVVIDDWQFPTSEIDVPVVLRTGKEDLFKRYGELKSLLARVPRVNVIVTDEDTFSDEDLQKYDEVLDAMVGMVESLYVEGKTPQLNLLTDRMMLASMNNCGAGDTNLTLAPNGHFYICPAFYFEGEEDSVGDLEHGVDIPNKRLYKLDYAPICRHCDAWQCKRCVWLNRKMTLEVNTPSRQQCVMSHLERNASRKLLEAIRQNGDFLPDMEISEIDYLDPFDKRNDW